MDRSRTLSWSVLPLVVVCVTAAARDAGAQASFTDQTAAAGLTFNTMPAADAPGLPMWGGLSVGDFNNDGWPDVFVASGGGGPDALFINNGNGTFTNQAAAWGLTALYRGNGTAVGDVDSDGDLDIYVTSAGDMSGPVVTGANRLYRNNFAQGSNTFTDVAAAAGVNVTSTTVSMVFPFGAAFGDYNRDGHLDLFVCSWRPGSQTGQDGNRLFRNNGDGTFTDVTVAAGVSVDIAGFSPRFADMNNDGWPEIIIAADWVTSKYFRNNGDGTFTNLTASAGVGLDQNGMGSTIGDFNQDGQPEWYVTSIESNLGNFLYVNQGNDKFTALPASSGAKNGGWGWGTAAMDFDNDGDVDIGETNGWFQGQFTNDPTYLFRNNGNMTFTDVAAAAGLINTQEGRAFVTLDYDRDGDLDIIQSTNNNTAGGPIYLYRSELSGANAGWLEVMLDPDGHANIAPSGVGSVVRIRANGTYQYFNLVGGSNFLGQSELIAHFGLGSAAIVDEVVVLWGSGTTTVLTNVAINQLITVTPPAIFTPSLQITDVSINEGNSGTSNAVFTVSLSAAIGVDVVVDFQTVEVTASNGVDYTSVSGSLTILAGTTSGTVTVQVIGDTVSELNETFLVQLSNAVNAFIFDAQGVGTIVDNDGQLLSDDFDDGVMDWIVAAGTWTESGGVLTGSTPNTPAKITPPLPWTPSGQSSCLVCSVETTMTLTGSIKAGIVGWHTDWANFVGFTADKPGNRWAIEIVKNGRVVQKKRVSRTIATNTPYLVKLTYDGTRLRGYVNGLQDASLIPSTPLVAGNVGARVAATAPATFEFFKVF